MTEQEWAARQVLKAWNDAGPNPAYHNQMKAKLRQEWPTLAQALDVLAAARGA